MSNHNLFCALRSGFPDKLDQVAIDVCDGDQRACTWRDLEHGSAMLANLLQSLDLPPDSRIAVQTEKSIEAVMLYLAVLRAGFVYLPLNTAYQAAEIEHFVRDAEPAVVVCSGRNFGWVSQLAFVAGTTHVFTLDDDHSGSLLQRAAHHADTHAPVQREAGDLAVILYTSGTTGRSKGAMLTHGNMLSNATTLKAFWHWQAGDVLIHALPMFHIHGLFVALNGALLNGTTLRWLAKFDAARVLGLLGKATIFMGVPTMYGRLLAEPGLTQEACAGMRLFVSGSAPLSAETFDAFRQRTGQAILERYGMSETGMITSNPYGGERRRGTVGQALPGVQVRVVDGEGRGCATGEPGNVEVKGPNVFAGYWRLPEKTREEFTADGWFRTGDVGRFDADGYLQIVGRSKDLIITGGYNVYPAEVEGFLDALPQVAESAVVGVPHPDFGEAVLAVVVPRPDAQVDAAQVIATLKQQVAGFKVPKQVVVAAELPRNAMGKVQKNLLRERHAAAFHDPVTARS
jgi:malonyl-CoA/methylmalonyl-CoA synthetase